jgi:ubiquinone/menaquinone biosynthesis C-methylase UbiE
MIKKFFSNKLVKFFFVGGINTLFGIVLYSILILIGFGFVWASLLGIIIGIVFNFQTYGGIVFKNRNIRLIFRFIGVYAIMYIFNIGGIWIFKQYIVDENALWLYELNIWFPFMTTEKLEDLLGGLFICIPNGLLGFILNRKFVFSNENKSMNKDKTVSNFSETYFDNTSEVYDKGLQEILGLKEDFDLSVFAEYKAEILSRVINPSTTHSILEFGCGTGRNIPFLRNFFPEAKIYGSDVSQKSLQIAQERLINNTTFLKIDEPAQLKQLDSVDCVFITNVFHHIPFDEHNAWMKGLYETIKSGGKLIIFEHNPLNPIVYYKLYNEFHGTEKWGERMLNPKYTKRMLRKALFKNLYLNYTLFFLKRSNIIDNIEKYLRFVPFGAQYYIVGEKTTNNHPRG